MRKVFKKYWPDGAERSQGADGSGSGAPNEQQQHYSQKPEADLSAKEQSDLVEREGQKVSQQLVAQSHAPQGT